MLDLRATFFLPEFFIAYTTRRIAHDFTRKVAQHVNYLESNNLEAISAASGYLVLYGRTNIAEP